MGNLQLDGASLDSERRRNLVNSSCGGNRLNPNILFCCSVARSKMSLGVFNLKSKLGFMNQRAYPSTRAHLGRPEFDDVPPCQTPLILIYRVPRDAVAKQKYNGRNNPDATPSRIFILVTRSACFRSACSDASSIRLRAIVSSCTIVIRWYREIKQSNN